MKSIVVVEKPKTGKLRICLDPRAFNNAIKRPHYALPTLEDVTVKLSNATYFSTLDITHAYCNDKLDKPFSPHFVLKAFKNVKWEKFNKWNFSEGLSKLWEAQSGNRQPIEG